MQIRSLQYLRAFAAISVVLFHYRDAFTGNGGSQAIASLVSWGHGGVPIFFVLAGFIMVWTTRLEMGASQFLLRRVIRVYGGYLPIALVFLLYKAETVGVNYWVPGGLNIWGSLTLSETSAAKSLIFPAWSLTFELMFYAGFAVCLLFPKRYFFAACLGVCLVVFSCGTYLPLPDGYIWLLTSPLNLLFLIGVGVGYACLFRFHFPKKIVFALAALVVLCYGVGFWSGDDQYPPRRILTFGLGTAALILLLVQQEALGRIPNLRFIGRLGDASYAIYLLHIPLKFTLAIQGGDAWLALRGGPYLVIAANVLLLCAASLLYFEFVERPINRYGRRAVLAYASRRFVKKSVLF